MSFLIRQLFIKATVLVFVLNVFGQSEKVRNIEVSDLTVEELIAEFSSSNESASTKASIELFVRGEKIIPYLLKLKGNNTLFRGHCLGDPKGSDYFIDGESQAINDGTSVTVEVASRYVVSASYYDNLAFAKVPYLTDVKQGHNSGFRDFKYNTRRRIRKAWQATERWYGKLRDGGLEKLRTSNESPLKSTKIFFLGTNPLRKRDITACG